MKKQLLILITLFTAVIGYSQSLLENGIYYEVLSGTNEVDVIGYNSASGTDVVIPSTVTSSAGVTYNVTRIKYNAFENKGLTSVIIPNSVISILSNSFKNNLLTSIVIPNNITSMGEGVFSFNQLTSIDLSNLTAINGFTFSNNLLTTITIPNTITFISSSAFANNPLSDVTSLRTSPPSIVTGGIYDTFNSDRSAINLYIPIGSMGAYVTNTGALWTGFNTVTEGTLSVKDFELANNLKVITITNVLKITSSNSIRLQKYSIYSLSGTQVLTGTRTEINTASLTNGIYILKLDFDKGSTVKKVIIN